MLTIEIFLFIIMECEIAISRVCSILDVLSLKVKELIENSGELLNIIECEHKNSLNASRNLIIMLNRLRCLVEMRMRTSPAMKRERASNLASALVNEKKARVEAEILLDSIRRDRLKHQSYVNDLKAQIAVEKLHLEEIQKNYELNITKKRNESRLIVEKIIEETTDKKEKLRTEIELKKAEFENISGMNMKNERELYEMRKKAEQEYLDILAKYDNNVGGLYRTMESLIEESNLLDTNLGICQEKMVVQEIEYKMLKNEKESEILRIFTENFNKFRRKRAAKIIQVAWRRYLERLLLRKKKKSKKKK